MNTQSKHHRILQALLITVISIFALAPAHAADTVKVTADNYVRAETDLQLKVYAEGMDAFGKFNHNRKHYDVDNQLTIRGNHDTIYSFGGFDLTSPLTITLPDPGDRFQSLAVVNQDHSILPTIYGPGRHTFTMEDIGTRYIFIGIRTFADANDPADIKAAHALQDAIKVEQADIGKLELPNWDKQGVETLREALNVLGATITDTTGYFGKKEDLDPIHWMMGCAYGWGGNPKEAAVYVNFVPEKNDGKTPYTLAITEKVPVDGFVSVTVYNAEGFMEKNDLNSYAVNNITAKKDKDGSVTIHFGGDPKANNYIPITKGWNYIVRLYQPRQEILDGSWTFPTPQEAQ